MIGQTVDDLYQIKRLIMSDHSGQTYEAFEGDTDTTAAVKFLHWLPPKTAQPLSPSLKQQFETLTSLAHPGLLSPFAYGLHRDRPYLIAPPAHGIPLAQEATLAPLGMERLIYIGYEICQTLALLHDRGLIHGSLNALTVTLIPMPNLPLVQLGGLGYATSGPILWAEDAGAYFPYLSPEQIAGQTPQASADLYSLGVILYQLAAGTLPFSPEEVKAARPDSWFAAPPSPHSLNARIPPALEQLLNALLQGSPAVRPTDVHWVGRQLQETGQTTFI